MRKVVPILTLILFAIALALPLSEPQTVEGQTATEALTTDMDAKTDDLFNGFGVKGTPIDECVAEPEPPTARGNGRFEDNKFIFSEREIRARNRLMHEGLNITIFDAIQLHAGQATASRNAFNALTATQRADLIAFVLSL